MDNYNPERILQSSSLMDYYDRIEKLKKPWLGFFMEAWMILRGEKHYFSEYNLYQIHCNHGQEGHYETLKGWNYQGRTVMKGQHGITILTPVYYSKRELKEKDALVEGDVKFYRNTTIFHYSQTQESKKEVKGE